MHVADSAAAREMRSARRDQRRHVGAALDQRPRDCTRLYAFLSRHAAC